MSLIEKPYRVVIFLILAVIGGMAAQPGLAGETITLGGNGGALGTMKRLGSAFEQSHPGYTVVVLPSLGTSGGIKAVAKGAIDIGLSARMLSNEELKLGLAVTGYARTPLVFAVKAGHPLTGLSQDEYLRLLKGESRPGPNDQRMRPILRPANDAETMLVGKRFPAIGAAIERKLASPDATVALTSQEAADLIEKIPGAIGFSPLSLIRSENRQVKVLPFNGVTPSAANVSNGSYPLVMDLYLVSQPDPPERVRKFIEYVRSEPAARLLEDSGNYVAWERK